MGTSIDGYLKKLEGHGGEQEPSKRTSLDDRFDRLNAEPIKLDLSLQHATPAKADQAARILKLQERTQVPADVIGRNIDAVEQRAPVESWQLARMQREAPALASWLSEHPNNASVAGDDIPKLSLIEKLFVGLAGPQNLRAAFTAIMGRRSGARQSEQGMIGYEAIRRGGLDEPAQRRLADIEREIGTGASGKDFLTRVLYSGAQIVGQMFESAPMSAAAGLVGAGTGAMSGALGGPVGAAVGGGFGLAAGIGTYSYQVEAGQAYLELSKMRDANGIGIDEDTKRNIALSVGALNGLLETVGLGFLASPYKTVARKFLRESVKDAMARPTMRAALNDVGKSYAMALGGETGTEVWQEINAIVGEEIAKMGSAGDFNSALTDPDEREKALRRIADVAQQTAEGMLLVAAPGAAIHGASTAYQARKASQREQYYLALGQHVSESKTFERLPDAVKEVVLRATKDGPIETVYQDVETFDTYFQSKKLDPQAVAKEIGLDKEWEEAHRTGGMMPIPMSTYATRLAPTEHNAFFAKELRAKPNEMNAREAEGFLDQMKQQAEATADLGAGEMSAAQQIEATVSEQLIAAGYEPSVAKVNAQQLAAFFRTQATRAGLDPLEYFKRQNFTVAREPQAAPAALGQKVSLSEVANRALSFREQQGEMAGRIADEADAPATPYHVDRSLRDAALRTDAKEFVYARTNKGTLRGNLTTVSTEGLIEELAHLFERQSEDANRSGPTLVPDENMHTFSDQRAWVGRKFGAAKALGRMASRGKSITRIEGELQRRGATNADEQLFKRLAGDDISFDPSTFQQSAIQRFVALRGAEMDPNNSPPVRAEAARRAAAIEQEARAELKAKMSKATAEYAAKHGEEAAMVFHQAMAGGDQPRGQISFKVGDQAAVNITLLADADLSTFLHESGHFYLEVMRDLATMPDAAPAIAADFEIIKGHVGWQEGQTTFTREQHETWARSFELYLMEGKAPSSELRGAFGRYRAWLVGLYRTFGALQVFLTDDVRAVMDRLLASEDEIAAAQREQKMDPLFADPAAVGMTEQQAASYREAVLEARQTAEDELARRLIDDVRREQDAVYKAERVRVRTEVAEEVNQERDSMAMAFLARGTLPDGSPAPAELEAAKLSKQALEAEYADRYPNLMARLRSRFLYSKEGGLHPDQVAEWFGYASGDELIQSLLAYEGTPRQRIEQLTDERMRKDDPNLVTPAELPIEAMKAVHNEMRAKVLMKELEHLASENLPALKGLVRRISRRIPPLGDVKAQAENIIRNKRVRDINPLLYQRAEEKAARMAVDALLKGDVEAAFDEKQRELLNHELYRAATKAKEEVERVATDLARFGKSAVRERLGKAGGDYLEQIDAILERFDFRKSVSGRQIDRRRNLQAWYDEQVAQGNAPLIPQKLLDEAYRTHYKELTLAELRDVYHSVLSIEKLSNLKNTLMASARARALEEARVEIIGSIEQSHDLKRKPQGHPPDTLRRRLAKGSKRGLAEHTRMEFLFDYLDGFKGLGIVWQYFMKPFTVAENAENEKLARDAEVMRDIFSVYTPEQRAAWFTQKVYVAAARSSKHDGNFTKASILAAALNWGNDYNRDALMQGYDWTMSQVEAVLDTLDGKDWITVQRIWDHIETYWPEVEQLEKDLVGVAPQKVVASPVTNRHGQFRGGYYPILFDRERSVRQYSLDEKSNIQEAFGGNAFRAMTRHGHTIERTSTGGKPLKLELSGLAEHMSQVVHDLTHRRAVIDVWKLASDPEIAQAIELAVGSEMYLQLRPWLQSIAGDRARAYSGFTEKMLGRARQGATVVGLGLKVTSATLQALGYTLTTNEIGVKYAAHGLKSAFGNPRRIARQWAFIIERSAMMRDRMQNYDRDVRDYARRQSAIDGAQTSWFFLVGYMDLATSVPTWLGSYRKAMDGALEGVAKGDELSAIDYADKIVRETQAAGAAKDLASIQRGGEAFRLFTMFYSSMSIIFNQFARAGQRYAIERNLPQLVASAMLIWIMPVVLEAVIRGESPDDDDSWAKFLAAKVLTYPFGAVVLLRDFANAFERKLLTGRTDFSGSPAGDVGQTALMGIYAATVKPFTDEDITRADWKAIVNTVGYATRLPTAQTWKTLEYFYDWFTGVEDPGNVATGLYRALVTGKPRH